MAEISELLQTWWRRQLGDELGEEMVTRRAFAIREVIKGADELELNKIEDVALENWLAAYDEFADWFIHLACLLHLAPNTDSRVVDEKWLAFSVAIGAIVNQLIAVRRLVTAGLDMPAKQILRCLVEYIDLAVRMTLDDAVRADFRRYDDIEGSGTLWKTHLRTKDRKNKAPVRNLAFAEIAKNLDPDRLEVWKDFRNREDAVLHACIHPSFIAARMATLGDYPRNEKEIAGWMPCLGLVNRFSSRTLSYAIMAMLDYVMMGYVPDREALPEAVRSHPALQQVLRHLYEGRGLLIRLADHLINHQYGASLSDPPDAEEEGGESPSRLRECR